MKNNSFFARRDFDDGNNLPIEFRLSQAIGMVILSKFSSLMENSYQSSTHYYSSGSLALQEAFTSISMFAGSLSVWFSWPKFNVLHKVSSEVFGPKSSSAQSWHINTFLKENLAGVHFMFGSDNEHAIKTFITKLASSKLRFLWKDIQVQHGLPILSLASICVPSFGSTSSKALAGSITFQSASEEISSHAINSDGNNCYHGCPTIDPPNLSWKEDAIEPKTGIKFPTFLDDSFHLTTKVLVGIGSRSMRIIKLKSLKLYAFGLYVFPDSVCEKLRSKYASVPTDELKNRSDFFEDFLREDIHMTVRLVINCKGLKVSTVRDAFEKSLRTRLQKLNPNTDYHCIRTFGSYFTQDITLPVGTIIDFRQTADGQLITEIGGTQIGAVHSKDLCRAFFGMYIGDLPVSLQAKEDIAENIAVLIRRC